MTEMALNGSQQSMPIDQAGHHTSNKHYKVVLENVTQEKKRLRIEDAYTDLPPRGYAFVPIGYPDVTEYCKEVCSQRGDVVYAVTTSIKERSKKQNKISRQINRAGFHFPSHVVAKAHALHGTNARHGGLFQTRNGLQYADGGLGNLSHLTKQLDNHAQRLRLHRSLNETQIKRGQIEATIIELFPHIPEGDVKAIVERAFKEGADTVGNADDMPLARKVQLAVGAHVRHTHTHYDQLLKVVDWETARKEIEKEVLAVLIHWRGEAATEANAPELEEIFREVIVIDDDDTHNGSGDDEDDYEPPESVGQRRQGRNLDSLSAQQALAKPGQGSADRTEYIHAPASARLRTQVMESSPGSRYIAQDGDEHQPWPGVASPQSHIADTIASPKRQISGGYARPQQASHGGWNIANEDGMDRPMFISSARPDEPAVYHSIEEPEFARKRKSLSGRASPAIQQDIDSTAHKRHRMEEPITPTHSSDATYPRKYRRMGDEDIEVIDLRSPATGPMQVPHQNASKQVRAYEGEQRQATYPYAMNERARPPRQRVYIDAYTGQPIARERVG